MSKDIWHTADVKPKPYEDVAFYVDGYLYSGLYEPQYNQYGIFGADKVEKWCYEKELSSYIPALETELERTRKALDVAVGQLKKTHDHIEDFRYQETNYFLVDSKDVSIILDETNEALEQITSLEQKDK